jgi:uncharacterized protein DUF6084
VNLGFEIVEVRAESYAAAPTLMARISVTESSGEHIHAIAAKCQIRVEPQRRRYSDDEEIGLYELFAEPARWGDTLKNFLWAHVSFMVPSFRDRIEVEVPINVTYDFEVSASKYFQALEGGDVPLIFLFNGTVFSKGGPDTPMGFVVSHVPWDKEASYRMPVATWRECMDFYFPNTAWIRMRQESFQALCLFKARNGLTSWEDTVATLLERSGADDLVPRNDPADRLLWPKLPPVNGQAAQRAEASPSGDGETVVANGHNGGGAEGGAA